MLLLAETEATATQVGLAATLIAAAVAILTILIRDGGPWLYKYFNQQGKRESVKARIKREGQEAVIGWLEERILGLEKEAGETKEEICALQKEHQDCLVKTATLQSELRFANEKIAALEAWKARRGGSDSIVVPTPQKG